MAWGTLFFLALEIILRAKLGSIYLLAASWALVHQWLALKLGHPGVDPAPARRVLLALYSALFNCAVIFCSFAVANAMARTVNNDWRWFQLP